MKGEYDEKRGMIKMWTDAGNIYDYFRRQGYFFPKEVITRYFLSLKTKPFVILTGISGTGKTKIAQVFAEYVCQHDTPEERARRVAFVSVRPDWIDNKGLLGYYNLLDEKYHSTPLLDLLIEARTNLGKTYFVILDEMNLAKVEQYFSDFLSVMESRTTGNPRGEPMKLHSGKIAVTPEGSEIPSNLHVPPNVYFTGTVNVDESTYMFSPKVLDRANVIEFNEVNLEDYSRGTETSDTFTISDPDVRSALVPDGDIPFCSRRDYVNAEAVVGERLREMLEILRPYNLHFGYRVANEVCRFVARTKEVVKNFDIDETLDIQISQKILPKFHGSRATLEEPLRKLFTSCSREQAGMGLVAEAHTAGNGIEERDFRYPRSARKLQRMVRALRTQGYTSFIE